MADNAHIPVSWVSVHHKPASSSNSRPKVRGRMHSLDDDMLSDTQNRMSLYHYEEFNINEEDDVFMDSVETIVSQHRQARRLHRRLSRISSNPDYHSSTAYVLPTRYRKPMFHSMSKIFPVIPLRQTDSGLVHILGIRQRTCGYHAQGVHNGCSISESVVQACLVRDVWLCRPFFMQSQFILA